jgi:hypothetical protein
MKRAKFVLILIVTAVGSMVVGAAAAAAFVGAFMSDATDSRFIADATLYLTALEKIGDGDTVAVSTALKEQLKMAILGLQADSDRLSVTQRKQYLAIQQKAARFQVNSGPT